MFARVVLRPRHASGSKDERSQALNKLVELRKQIVNLEKELNAYGDCDPVKIEDKKRAVFLAKEAALRWTGKPVFCEQSVPYIH